MGRRGLSQLQQENLLILLLGRYEEVDGEPPHGLTYAQIATRMGINESTVIKYAKSFGQADPDLAARLRYRGSRLEQIPEAMKIVRRISESENPPEGFKPTRDLAQLERDDPAYKFLREGKLDSMSPDEMMAELSKLAKSAPPQYRVAAIQALDRLMATYKPAETFGPPAPLSEPDRVSRLTRLLDCVGIPTLLLALESLWPGSFSYAGPMPTSTSTDPQTSPSPDPSNSPSSKPEDGSLMTDPMPSASEWIGTSAPSASEGSTPSPAPS